MRGWMNMEEKKKDERLEEKDEALTDKALDEVLGGSGDIVERPNPEPSTERPPETPRWRPR